MLEEIKLKPCPFCGEKLEKGNRYWVHPENECLLARAGYDYRPVILGEPGGLEKDEKAWNRRYPDAP